MNAEMETVMLRFETPAGDRILTVKVAENEDMWDAIDRYDTENDTCFWNLLTPGLFVEQVDVALFPAMEMEDFKPPYCVENGNRNVTEVEYFKDPHAAIVEAQHIWRNMSREDRTRNTVAVWELRWNEDASECEHWTCLWSSEGSE